MAQPGMPQLDPSSFPSQLFWLTVSFVALYVLLARFVLPRIHDVLEYRKEHVGKDLEKAAQFKQEAEMAKQRYEKALAEARAQSQELLISTTQMLDREKQNQEAELEKILAKKLTEAEAAIAKSRSEVLDKLRPVSAELAAIIVEKLVHHKPNAEDIQSALSILDKQRQV